MTASKILQLARLQLGVKESPADSNTIKYNTDYYGWAVSGSDYPWCCVFIWWLFKECDALELFYGGDKTASCTTLMNYHKKSGQLVESDFKPGDLVLFNWQGNKSFAQHIGIVESVNGDTITTIEGNTSVNCDDNGGSVMRRLRNVSVIIGALRPDYEEDDKMSKTIEQIATIAGLSEDETINALGILAKFANIEEAKWEVEGEHFLKETGLINTDRDGRELVEFGELGVILKRYAKMIQFGNIL